MGSEQEKELVAPVISLTPEAFSRFLEIVNAIDKSYLDRFRNIIFKIVQENPTRHINRDDVDLCLKIVAQEYATDLYGVDLVAKVNKKYLKQ